MQRAGSMANLIPPCGTVSSEIKLMAMHLNFDLRMQHVRPALNGSVLLLASGARNRKHNRYNRCTHRLLLSPR